MAEQLTDAIVIVNGEPIPIVPGSLRITEGIGASVTMAQSEGQGRISQVFAVDQSTAIGRVMFSLYSTPENIERHRRWKLARNRNSVQIASEDSSGQRVFRNYEQGAINEDAEIPFSVDGRIEVAFSANSPT